jgi:hypothetical protein
MTMICTSFLGGIIGQGLVALRTSAVRYPSHTTAAFLCDKLLYRGGEVETKRKPRHRMFS